MKDQLIPGMYGGKTFNKGTNPEKKGVEYGPNTKKVAAHPITALTDAVNGMNRKNYEPNGLVHLDPDKIKQINS